MAFSGNGAGILGDPYQITTWAQFKEIANELSAHYQLMNNIDAGNDYFYAGTLDFTGILEGNNYTVSNLRQYSTSYAVLFRPEGATIKNINIDVNDYSSKCSIFSASSTSSYATNTIFQNINVFGSVRFAYSMTGCQLTNVNHSDTRKTYNDSGYYFYFGVITDCILTDCVFIFNKNMNPSGATQGFGIFGVGNSTLRNTVNNCTILFDFLTVVTGSYQHFGVALQSYTDFNNCIFAGKFAIDGSGVTASYSSTRYFCAGSYGLSDTSVFTDCHFNINFATSWAVDQANLSHSLFSYKANHIRCFNTSTFTGFTRVGTDTSTFTDCYALESGIIPGVTTIKTGVTLLTDAQAQDQANFTNFDFTNTWEIFAEQMPKLLGGQYDGTNFITEVFNSFEKIIEGENKVFKINLLQPFFSLDNFKFYSAKSATDLENATNELALTLESSFVLSVTVPLDEYLSFLKCKFDNGSLTKEISTAHTKYSFTPAEVQIKNVVAPDYIVFDDPAVAWLHGSIRHNGYLYLGSRQGGLVKINEADYSDVTIIDLYVNQNTLTTAIPSLEQFVFCAGFLWLTAGGGNTGYLIRIDPDTLEYIVFSNSVYSGGIPIAADERYLYVSPYLSEGFIHLKIDTALLIDTAANLGFSGVAITLPSAAIVGQYDSSTQGNCKINVDVAPEDKGFVHSALVDDKYLYLTYIWVGTPGPFELHKVEKSTMKAAGFCTIPICTDDAAQDEKYIYLGPEGFTDTTNPLYGSMLLAVRKEDLKIFNLTDLKPVQFQWEREYGSYGVKIYGNYIVFLSVSYGSVIIIDKRDVENWNFDYPAAGALVEHFDFTINGSGDNILPNEFLLDVNGNAHVTSWETPAARLFKFPTNLELTPVIQSYLKAPGSDTATLGGFVIAEGKSPVTAVGFKYGTDPENLTNDLQAALAYDFEATLNSLAAGIYYFQAYATNTEGTFYGNTVVFSTYNTISASNDSAAALLAWVAENYGCSIRCVQNAPGIADGTTGTATDQDGNQYNTIVINGKRWMIENLKARHFRNGDEITEVTDAATWAAAINPALAAYENNANNV